MTAESDEVVVFIVSRHTTTPYRRVLWRMTRANAMKVCTDPRTATSRHGLHWTAVAIDDQTINRYVPDDGRYAEVLREHEVTVLRSHSAGPQRIAA